jgi:hypothetical protein
MKKFWFLVILTIGAFTANAQKVTVEVEKALIPPVIDGVEEEVWDFVTPIFIEKNFGTEEATVTAYWKALWNDTAIFIMVNVMDDDHFPSWESGGMTWEYDRVELYFDVNDVLQDGLGPANSGSGHYQSSPNFEENGYGIRHTITESSMQFPDCQYAYLLTGTSYVIEQSIPAGAFSNQNGDILSMNDLLTLPEHIGFDVTIADQDQDITTGRQRKVWQADGKIPGQDEAWNSMDDCGVIVLKGGSPVYSADTVLCDSTETAIIAFSLSSDSVATYEWDTDEGAIQYENAVSCWIKWNDSGIKNVKLTIQTKSGNTHILEQDVIVYPKLSVSLGDDLLVCNKSYFTIVPDIINGNRPFSYTWNYLTGDSVYNGYFVFDTPVRISVRDATGCSSTDEVNVSVTGNPDAPSICMVTVDAATNKNKIIWQKSSDKRIRAYKVFKESKVAGQFTQIGTVPVNIESTFTDTASQPSRYADRYALVTMDTCDGQSALCDAHQPVHLQISQGLPGNYNLSWSPYIGFGYSTYNIYKGKSVDQMVLIDELASSKTQYTDTSSGLSYYRVTVKKDFPCIISDQKSSGSEYDEAGSNVVNTLATEIISTGIQIPFRVYPNPFDDEMVVEMETTVPRKIKIEVYTMLGVKIYEYRQEVAAAGNFRHIIYEKDIPDISAIHILRLEAGDQTFFLKIIKNE